jgi:tetratricopeptide (TPR) repeat protein
MKGRDRRIVAFIPPLMVVLALVAGCGQTREPTPTEADRQATIEHYKRGVEYQEGDQLDLAIVEYTQAIALDPQYAKAYGNRGVAYYDKGDLDRAIADLSEYLEIDPNNAIAYLLRGAVYAAKEEREKAISDLERALALGLDPDSEQIARDLLAELQP